MLARFQIIIFFISFVFGFQKIEAQTTIPVEFQCATTEISGDVSLQWLESLESCGPFVEYIIYASNTITGPYAILDYIFVETTTNYVHVGADGTATTWYYYIEALYDCPGWIVSKSDTLDNLDPAPPEIYYVTVQVGGVDVYWKPSTSAKTSSYKIYRDVGGFTEVGSVLGIDNTHYFDFTATPSSVSESYTAASEDYCGNEGPFNEFPHQTILLSLDWSLCSYSVDLFWNAYEGWGAGGVLEYQLWAEIGGDPSVYLATIPASEITYTYPSLIDGLQYFFTIRALKSGDTIESISNQVGLTAEISSSPLFSIMRKATVVNNDYIQIEWYNDVSADIKTMDVLKSPDQITYNTVSTIDVSGTAATLSGYNDYDVNVQQGNYSYQILSEDFCNTILESDIATTIFLSGNESDNFINQLNWNAYNLANADIISYTIFRDIGSGFVSVGTTTSSSLQYQDDINAIIQEASSACYYIEATYNFSSTELGISEQLTSQSNTICIDQESKIFVPNAIVPGSTNGIFKPSILFGEEKSYSMKIVNRYSEIIFQTSDFSEGWDGTFKGQIVPLGTYAYIIQYSTLSGEEIIKKGNVTVIQ